MRPPISKVSAESSYQRDLKRLISALTSISDGNSIVSLISDYFRFTQFAAGERGNSNNNGKVSASALMPELWFSAEKILLLTDGATQAETLTRTAKLLGTLQLTVPQSARRWREIQFGYKVLYRCALSLRLLDHVLAQQLLADAELQLVYAQRNAADPDCPYRPSAPRTRAPAGSRRRRSASAAGGRRREVARGTVAVSLPALPAR